MGRPMCNARTHIWGTGFKVSEGLKVYKCAANRRLLKYVTRLAYEYARRVTYLSLIHI